MKAVVVADGDVLPAHPGLGGTASGIPPGALVVAADGGARKAVAIGLQPDVVVGDMDSLGADEQAALERSGVEIQRHPPAKDATDTELALLEAVRRGASELVVLGALGGPRFEHSLANVLLLTLPELEGSRALLVHGPVSVRVMGTRGADELSLEGRRGDLLSLLPLTELVEGVSTTGLAYPLRSDSLRQGPARGVSNVFLGSRATVTTTRGRLAVIHTTAAATAGDADE